MGYHKRNRITYHGVKGERIIINEPVKKKVHYRSSSSFFDSIRMQDLALAILFLTIGVGCILTIILS